MVLRPLLLGSAAMLLTAVLAVAAAAQTPRHTVRPALPVPSAPSAVTEAPAPVPAWTPTWTRSLAFGGAVDGLILVGADDTQEVWLPLPQRLTLEEARLRLPWRAQLPGYHIATVSVFLNGRPAGAWRLDGAGGQGVFEIPLSAQDLRAEGLRVVFHLRGGLGGDWCVDERFARGFVQIQPEGALEARHLPPRDVGAHLEALPHDVRLAVPSPATDAEMRAALAAAVLLERAGHHVTFQEGHVAGAHVAVAAGSGRIGAPETIDRAFGVLGGDGVAAVDGVVLVAAGETAPGAFTALGRRLAGAATMGISQATAGSGGRRFAELGLFDREIRVLEEGSLTQPFHLRDLPAGRWPEAVDISLVAPPRQGAAPILAYLHINGVLAGVHPLGDQGGEQRLRFRLPREAIGVSNQLRLTLQREAPSGACRTQPVPALFQWRADSMLHLADAPEHATDAATFTALHYAPTMTVSPEALARPAAALAAATFVLRDALRPVVPPAAAGEQALIHLGRLPVETARRLDLQPERGIARIVGPDASRLFLDGVPTPAGMQVLANGVLEILPAREAFRPAEGRIHREAAAAFDARGVVARADADPRVAPLPPSAEAPDAVASSWASWLLRLAIGLGGAVLGGLAIHLWRRRI
jgi:hypothetical protein